MSARSRFTRAGNRRRAVGRWARARGGTPPCFRRGCRRRLSTSVRPATGPRVPPRRHRSSDEYNASRRSPWAARRAVGGPLRSVGAARSAMSGRLGAPSCIASRRRGASRCSGSANVNPGGALVQTEELGPSSTWLAGFSRSRADFSKNGHGAGPPCGRAPPASVEEEVTRFYKWSFVAVCASRATSSPSFAKQFGASALPTSSAETTDVAADRYLDSRDSGTAWGPPLWRGGNGRQRWGRDGRRHT